MSSTSLPTTWDHEVDVVAVGSGLGGLTAAILAHDHGASALVLEKHDRLGGVCAWSGGEVFVPCNHQMPASGYADTLEEARAYLSFLAGGYADPELAEILLQTGIEAARYLQEKAGVRWKCIKDFPDYHHPHAPGTAAAGRYLEVELFPGAELGEWQRRTWNASPHMPPGITHDELFDWGSLSCVLTWDFKTMGRRMREDARGFGPGMMAYFVRAAMVDRKIPALTGTPARELLRDAAGAVVGVRAEGPDGQTVNIRARRGVVIATGGYDWHPDLARFHEGLPAWKSLCQGTVEGDNVTLGGEVGAALAGVPPYNLGMFFGYRIPGETSGDHPLWRASWEGGYPHALWVNQAGERFCDESFYRDYLPRTRAWDGQTQGHPNYPPYLVFDQSFRDKYALGPVLPGMPIPDGLLEQADTPAGLAEKLGIDPAGLEATIAHFNTFADGPDDPDFGRGRYPWAAMMVGDRTRPNPNMGPLNRAPYYGMALHPVGVGINAVGLRTDRHARVLHVRGHAIPGLYAVGNASALLDTGAGYQSGLSNLRGMTWGYVAGRHAATSSQTEA